MVVGSRTVKKRPELGVNHPPLSRAAVKEGVEQDLYSPSGFKTLLILLTGTKVPTIVIVTRIIFKRVVTKYADCVDQILLAP
jgi:hypothetical protein